eukprot:COSAG05_NODE_9511_length_619_cov_0.917308_2_plen_45_part_00
MLASLFLTIVPVVRARCVVVIVIVVVSNVSTQVAAAQDDLEGHQ